MRHFYNFLKKKQICIQKYKSENKYLYTNDLIVRLNKLSYIKYIHKLNKYMHENMPLNITNTVNRNHQCN